MDDLISRQAVIAEFNCCELTPDGGIDANYAIEFLEQLPTAQPEVETQMSLADCISRQDALDAIDRITRTDNWQAAVSMALLDLPSAQPEFHFDEWCVDCKEYDHDKHCCPRFNKVIRNTLNDLQTTQPERKKGKWIRDELYPTHAKCSICGYSDEYTYEDNYCPRCGARMKEGDLND